MDGAGVKINRVLTGPLQRRLDPFLMLDAFGSDKPGDMMPELGRTLVHREGLELLNRWIASLPGDC